MPHLPPAHHETSKHDSPNETKVKEKQKEIVSDSKSNLAKSTTPHNQTKERTTWFLRNQPWWHCRPVVVVSATEALRRQQAANECEWQHEVQMGTVQMRREKNAWFSNPSYFHWLTDEYRWVILISPVPHIFIGGVTSLTNIVHVYTSVTWRHPRICGAGQIQTGWPIYSSMRPIYLSV
jgi:hypothetical protein